MALKLKVFFLDDNIEYAQMFFEDVLDEFQVFCHEDSRDAIDEIRKFNPDIIILDVHMPFKSGYMVFKEIKSDEQLCSIPVLFLSADDTDETVIPHLDLHPEDFLFKTMSPLQVKKRILNRVKHNSANFDELNERMLKETLTFENLKMDHKFLKVEINSKTIELTSTEYRMLFYVLINIEKRPTKNELRNFIWGDGHVDGRTVNTHFSNLRVKISDADFIIKIGRLDNRITIVKKEEDIF